MDLAKRTVSSISWNVIASLSGIIIGLIRLILLARWLPVEVFGIYAFAGSIVSLSVVIPNFGMGSAFLHRSPETEDEDRAAASHFTLKLIFTSVWALFLLTGSLVVADGQLQVALITLTLFHAGSQLTHTPSLILTRRVVHRRLSLIRLIKNVFSTAVALTLAYKGLTLWALLSTDIVNCIINISLFYLWKPFWTPRLTWDISAFRYYLSFGSRSLVSNILLRALDRIDDLWTGLYLGKLSLGFYSRAYRFATYPRMILATPINNVIGGTYAELTGQRLGLSRAFFRINAFLVRCGFFMAGVLSLIAPELIRLLLGEKWMPMLVAFRLMLIFTLLEPIKISVGKLFIAVGKPEILVYTRTAQLVILLAGLFILGLPFDINGVAVAVDVMLLFGIALMFWYARGHVDFSIKKLMLPPALALIIGLFCAFFSIDMLGITLSDLQSGFMKFIIFSLLYVIVLIILERRQITDIIRGLLDLVLT